ncbi:MAG: HAMP domain-containing histidine kinase, partial [Oscillibacter sp.]|nr:HAMP domain-containing histidine kinase [Oscillibacter sp.]
MIRATALTLILEDGDDQLTYVERQQLEDELAILKAAMARENTNFRYQISSADGSTIWSTNLVEGESLQSVAGTIHYTSYQAGSYNREELGVEDYFYDSAAGSSADASADVKIALGEKATLIIACGVPEAVDAGIQDEFFLLEQDYTRSVATLTARMQAMTGLALLALACLLYLLWTAGHRPATEAIATTWQEHIFFDLYFATMFCAGAVLAALLFGLGETLYYYSYRHTLVDQEYIDLTITAAACALTALVAVIALTLRTLAVRCKARILARTTLVCRICGWIWSGTKELCRILLVLVRSLPIIWHIITAFLLYFFLNILFATQAYYDGFIAFLWFLVNALVLLYLCWWAVSQRKLRRGSQAIAAGNLDHQIDPHRMPHELKVTAENLNNISHGMAEAVNEQMKSERFKAELITNVSHDLKTPLTSIINYVNLLKTTEQTDPKAQEYIEVLDRKSQRLKKLTEDLVEASKASTGTLAVNRENIGMEQLIDQALGEWSEKLETRNLTVVPTFHDGETWVYADGRHLWRVLDNLLSNCAKYTMEGTRIYIDLNRGHGQVSLSIKNISRDALNVPADRLMERFVRGEESRSTEGSGLGLSIARSLTE